MARPLRLGFWNLNGYSSRTLGNKPKTKEFLNIINKHDIFALVETHATYDSELAVNTSNILSNVETSRENVLLGVYFCTKTINSLTESRTFQQKTKTPSGVNLIEIISDLKTIYT